MGVRTILAGLSGSTASDGTAEVSCRLAARFGAYLEAVHVRLDIAGLVISTGAEGLAAAAEMSWAQQMSAAVKAQAERTRVRLDAAAARHGLKLTSLPAPHAPSVTWHEVTGEAAAVLSDRARFFDLVILGRSDRIIDAAHTDAIEETLLRSGRPVLISPADPQTVVGETIAIGWNASAQSVRALVSALPFLHTAKETVIITLGERHGKSAESLEVYFRMHGITARFSTVPAVPGEGSGGQLLSAARDAGADLLVVGGYSRAPWREALFGGATHEFVGVSLLPVLISH